MTGIFQKIKESLEDERPVLFSGTPCQCHALLGFLGKKSDLLTTMSVICRGAASPELWELYVRRISGNGTLESFCFRDKSTANDAHTVSYTVDGSKTSRPMDEDPFSVMYLKCLSLRPSCYKCPYTKTDLPFDLSVGDLFNVRDHYNGFADGKGASLVITHTSKGEELLRLCGGDATITEIPIENAGQEALKKPAPLSPLRKLLFKDLAKVRSGLSSFDMLLKKYGGLR